jgi:hypothetical protein
MVLLLVLLSALLGAVAAGLAVFGYQLHVLSADGADPFALGAGALLVDVMSLPGHAGLGALTGALLAPLPGSTSGPVWGFVWRCAAGILIGLGASFVAASVAAGHLLSVPELVRSFVPDARHLLAGAAAGLMLALAHLVQVHVRRRRRRLREREMGEIHDVDAELKEFWRDRADAYLAQRDQGRTARH